MDRRTRPTTYERTALRDDRVQRILHPSVTYEGDGLGRSITSQRHNWTEFSQDQQ